MSKLFQKAKLAVKFRRAGGGHKLTESSGSSSSQAQPQKTAPRKDPTSDAQRAGQAALERFNQQEKSSKPPKSVTATWKSSSSSSSGAASHASDVPGCSEVDPKFRILKNEVKAEIRREMLDAGSNVQVTTEKQTISQEASPVLAVNGVFFVCPFCQHSHRRQQINNHMSDCLTKALEEDKTLTPANMIRTLNKDQDMTQSCVDILCRYLDNIVLNPDEEKYRKIKKNNKVFQQKVNPVKGSEEFLHSCGFVERSLSENEDESCLIIEEISSEVLERLTVMKEVLLGTERCRPVLDRSLKVFRPSEDGGKETLELPEDFFELRSDEVKRMQTERTGEVERSSQLRTKAMREAEGKNTSRVYKFTLLRVRFPDELILQGTFNSREKASSLISFVREQLQCDWLPFVLCEPGGRQLVEEDSTFAELGLIPAAILNFVPDASVMNDVLAAGTMTSSFLKPDLMK